MRRLIPFLLATGLASPALAQHAGHAQPPNPQAAQAAPAPAPAPAATCTPEHAAMGHCTMPAPAPAQACTSEHAAMGHCTLPAPAPAPAPAQTCTAEHATMGHCTMPTQAAPPTAADPYAGHQMPAPAQAGDPHAVSAGNAPAPPVAPPPPEALSGPPHAADTVFDPAAMARSRAALAEEHGSMEASRFLIDQLEVGVRDGHETYAWDAQFWHGGDIDKFWLKTEGEGEFGGELEGVEVQALWSRAIDPWFDLQLGIRQDLRPGPDRTHLVAGVQGLAPYWFEVEGAVFLSDRGEITARAEVEYDLRLTQNLILQPRGEMDFSLQDVPELGLGSGFTTAGLGARLRYEFFPRSGPAVVAPYVGVQYQRAFGDTADFRRDTGESAGGWSVLLGVRTWF